jgi:phage terminase large subunit GpA-like protein
MPIQPPTRPGYCNFLIAYQQEFFNQLTSEEVRTRFVRGRPVRYWFKPSGKRNEALDRRVYTLAALHARPVPWELLLRAAPTEPPATAAIAVTARRRRPARTAAFIAAASAGEPFRAPAQPL